MRATPAVLFSEMPERATTALQLFADFGGVGSDACIF